MAQQTAMQALVELMKINDIYKPCMPYLLEIIDEVYLPMEKEQIVKAACYDPFLGDLPLSEGENYFTKKYKK